MNGIEATRRIIAAHPEVVVILCSTYDVGDLPPDAGDQRGPRPTCNKEQLGAATAAAAVGGTGSAGWPGSGEA